MFKKLHAFHCGLERFANALFDPFSSDPAGKREIPYFFYLLEHSKGLVLFDTGVNPGMIQDIRAYLGPEAENWGINLKPTDDARALLGTVGVKAEDIHHVVLSHLHYDHAGAMSSFPNAQYWIQSLEWEYARNPPLFQQGMYVQSEFDVPLDRIRFMNGPEDMFGDGTIKLIPTPGHTSGHQSMLIKGAYRSYLLASDAAYEPDLIAIDRLPAAALAWSPTMMIESRLTLRKVRDETGALVFCTHDTAFRTAVKLAPNGFYE
jgi:N-acyl homoserine lactone hydrolase